MKNLLIAAAIFAASTSANANLIVNGSFEDTNQAAGTWSVYNSINGWTTVSGSGIEIRNYVEGTASNGSNFVELDSHDNSAMKQSIATTAGTIYELLYDYSPRVNQLANTNGISAYWNGTLLTNSTGNGNSTNNWVTLTFSNLVGTGGLVDLTFLATGISDSFGGNIDNVRLNAVPVPAAAWLFTSALGLFGLARRRSI